MKIVNVQNDIKNEINQYPINMKENGGIKYILFHYLIISTTYLITDIQNISVTLKQVSSSMHIKILMVVIKEAIVFCSA